MNLAFETIDITNRYKLLSRLWVYFDNGFRDPELLYLGARLAVSLGMEQEACKFLDILEKYTCPDGHPSRAFAGIGLLYLVIVSDEEKWNQAKQRLADLASQDRDLQDILDELDGRKGALENSPSIWLSLRKGEDIFKYTLKEAYLTPKTANLSGVFDLVYQVQDLAGQANQAYHSNQIVETRYLLEKILLLDGDQPGVLRNLITIVSEQQDIEAYERYWHRYVTLLLWHITCGEYADSYWQDLVNFYSRVAEVTNREIDKSINDLPRLLRRPAFLPRWLEAHTGLIWLEAVQKSQRILQIGAHGERLQQGYLGYLELMRYWLHLFYPQFEPYLQMGKNGSFGALLPSAEARVQLTFDPTIQFVRRCLEWVRFGFALHESNSDQPVSESHSQTILAMVGLLQRVPLQLYAKNEELLKLINKEGELEQKSLRVAIQEACSYPLFSLKLSKMLETTEEGASSPDWKAMVEYFGDLSLSETLSPSLRMFLALALCNEKRPIDGLRVACQAVTDMSAEELKEGTQNLALWKNVLHANIGNAINATSSPSGKAQASKGKVDHSIMDQWMEVVRAEVSQIPNWGFLVDFKHEALAEIDQIYEEQKLIQTAITNSQKLVQEGKFAQARKEVHSIPESAKELKQNLLDQVNQAEEHYKKQIEFNQRIEKAIADSKEFVSRENFTQARQTIRNLPDSPAELLELKKNLLRQIDDAEQQVGQQKLVDDALKSAQQYVQKADFYSARRAIERLPNNPQMKELKQRFLSQINEAENGLKKNIKDLEQRLQFKGIYQSQIQSLASLNNISTNDLGQYYGLLLAIEQQLGNR
ncbi:MAG: hypothetical protein AB1649_06770 [Chloroflexota bacterium]